MKTQLTYIVLAAALAWADAQAGADVCEGCNAGEAERTALGMGLGVHVVSSFATNEIRVFDVKFVGTGEDRILAATELEVPAEVKGTFQSARRFYLSTSTRLIETVKLDASSLGGNELRTSTAADIVASPILQNEIGDRLIEPLPGVDEVINNAIVGIASGQYSLVGLPHPTINFLVSFHDGSRVTYRLDEFAVTSAEFLPELSRAADGGSIE